MKKFYAHSMDSANTSDWQLLEDHLNNVAKRAADFAKIFGGEAWALIAGKNHDLGKGRNAWQAYLRRANSITDEFTCFYKGHPNHALVGAQQLFSKDQQAGKLLAYCIAGHHAGLANWNGAQNAALKNKLAANPPNIDIPFTVPEFPKDLRIKIDPDRLGFQIQFFVRMLFSCLADADYLDTETFLDSNRNELRGNYPDIVTLNKLFWKNFNLLRKKADPALPVNIQREHVLADSLRAAKKNPGIFSLTVPTGGGKTLATLAFALNHAQKYKKRRIIYVIPFTSWLC